MGKPKMTAFQQSPVDLSDREAMADLAKRAMAPLPVQEKSTMKRYDVMKQFTQGLIAGIGMTEAANAPGKSEHWHAGYLAGYEMRKEKNRRLDEYLISTGREPQAVFTLQSAKPQPQE